MSEFDREKEREKLREQFERDRKKREASERMSELLLQGATMINRHCPECHSPIFRYDGTEFCPTCQREVTDADEATDDQLAQAERVVDDQPAETGHEPAEPSDGIESQNEADEHERVQRRTERSDAVDAGETTQSADGRKTGEAPTEPDEVSAADTESPADEATDLTPAPERRPATPDPPVRREQPRDTTSGDLGDAEAALIRTITDLAHRAEQTRDVSRKREFLDAARDAIETLEALRRR